MNINCPHCGTEYEVDETYLYKFATCEACGKGFVVGATTKLTVPRQEGYGDYAKKESAFQQHVDRSKSWHDALNSLFSPWLDQWRLIFTFDGSIGRAPYFKFAGINILLYWIVYNFYVWLLSKSGLNVYAMAFIFNVVQATIVLSFVPATIKRLRDANRSIHWVWPLFAIAILTYLNLYVCIAAIVIVGMLAPNGGATQSTWHINSKRIKVAFLAITLIYAFLSTLHTYYVVIKAKQEVERILQNVPFHNISVSRVQGDDMSSVYMFTTDAPANATCFAVYVMGRLYSVQTVKSEDPDKVEEVKKYIQENFELESSLFRQPF